MAILLKQFEGSTVSALDDAVIYNHLEGAHGIFNGCAVSKSDTTTLSISAGRGMICGREFEVQAQTVILTPQDVAQLGRLIIEIDLTDTAEPIKFLTQLDPETLPELTQEDLNADGVIFQLAIATFNLSAEISNLENVDNELTPHVVPLAVTLLAGSWTELASGYTLTVNNTAFKEDATIICVASPESFTMWNEYGVMVASQDVYTLTFKSVRRPLGDIVANCLILR